MSESQALQEISVGEHCCFFFNNLDEHSRITANFLSLGFNQNERCVFVGSDDSIERIRTLLKGLGIDIEKELRAGRLILSSSRDYLDGDQWRTEKMLGFLQQAYDSTLTDGFSALRACGDVSWQVGPRQDFSDVVYYEALLDIFFIGKKMLGICGYPKDKCPPDTLSGILNTHKTAILQDSVCPNFHYVAPQILIEKDEKSRQAKRVDWMTSQLLRAKMAEDERDRLQSRLLQSQKLEAVGRLAAGVAHDFNNILTAILSLADFVLNRDPLDGEIRSDVREIRTAGERASALTRQLLMFSRPNVLQTRVLNVNDVVISMEKFLRRLIREDIDLKTSLDPNLGNAKADAGQLEQLIMNLVVNARDAMPDGGKLTIETAEVELDETSRPSLAEVSPGPYVMLSVTDTGQGMDQATLQRIFEPFFTTKQAGRGTGLGLALVQDIIKQSQGTILVDSEPGKGTTFKIFLPRVSDKRPQSPRAPVAGARRGTETVLVVEDDEAVRRLVKRTLQEQGYTVLAALTPRQALEMCQQHPGTIHLLVTDAVLPEMAGSELAKRACALQPTMKVLLMSGYADRLLPHHPLPQNAGFIEKPFPSDTFIRKVRDTLDPPVSKA